MTHAVGNLPPRLSQPFVAERFVATVGGQDHVVRGLPIWPIADVLRFLDSVAGMECGWTTADEPSGDAAAATGLLADLLDSSMISPPRLRNRRQRAVSSRAVFYQNTARIPG